MLLSCKLEVNGTLCTLALEVEGTLCALPCLKKNPNSSNGRDQEEDGEVGGGAGHKAHSRSNLSANSENIEILTFNLLHTFLLQLPHMFPPMAWI